MFDGLSSTSIILSFRTFFGVIYDSILETDDGIYTRHYYGSRVSLSVTSKILPRDSIALSRLNCYSGGLDSPPQSLAPNLTGNDAGGERRPGIYLDSMLVRCSVPVSPHKGHKSLSNHSIFSQVVENLRRQSCEGLALPFLANWLMGI